LENRPAAPAESWSLVILFAGFKWQSKFLLA